MDMEDTVRVDGGEGDDGVPGDTHDVGAEPDHGDGNPVTGAFGGSAGPVAEGEAVGGDTDRVVRDAAVVSVSGGHVDVSDSAVLSLAAGSVEAHDTLIVVGSVGELAGDAKVLVDARSAVLFGAVLGLVAALVGALLRCGGSNEAVKEGDCCELDLES